MGNGSCVFEWVPCFDPSGQSRLSGGTGSCFVRLRRLKAGHPHIWYTSVRGDGCSKSVEECRRAIVVCISVLLARGLELANEPQRLDPFSERVAACSAGLAVIRARLVQGKPAVEGLTCPPPNLDDEHRTERAFRELLGSAPEIEQDARAMSGPWMPPPQCRVIDEIIDTLVPLVRGQSWEPALWRYLLPHIPSVIPTSLVDDLIARDIEVVLLGHQLLRDVDLWKLVEVEEALLTLAIRRFVNTDYDFGEFEEVLYSTSNHGWVLESLVRQDPSDHEKLDVLASYVSRSPERDVLLERSSTKLRGKVEQLSQ